MNTLILDALSIFKKLPVFGAEKINSLKIINSIECENETFERIILLQNGNIDDVPARFKNITVTDTSAENVLNIMLKEAKNSENIIVDMGETKSGKGLIISFFDSEDHEDKRFASFILPNNSK